LKRNRCEKIKNEIREAVWDLHSNGFYPGTKRLRRKLTNPNCILRPEFREVWKKELELLGYKNH
jgi:hypothetical protein